MKVCDFIVAFTQCVLCVTNGACADARQARINLKERASRAKKTSIPAPLDSSWKSTLLLPFVCCLY